MGIGSCHRYRAKVANSSGSFIFIFLTVSAVLAQNEYLDKPEFLDYIEYLQYWRSPEYVRFIVFPHALYFLRMLREDAFREAIKRGDYTLMLHQQQGYYWQFARTMKEHVPPPFAQNGEAPAPPAEPVSNANS